MCRFIYILAGIILIVSCRKDKLLTSSDAPLYIALDSLHFDTVFTTAGSITQSFRIKNEQDQRIRISSIQLAGGASSVFRINVNGEQGPRIQSVDIAGGDSAHVFVNLQIPANAESLPFIVRDSIFIKWNGQEKWIQLEAYGQNARYIKNGIINESTNWDNLLPYVLIGPLTVEENSHLHISKGTRVYAHADAAILVLGRLTVEGDTAKVDRVLFTGNRLDAPYSGFPASWPGIYFSASSKENRIEYASVLNSYQGLVVQGSEHNNVPKLTLGQVIIDNALDVGLLAINSSVTANNLLISNCGKSLQVAGGGDYVFNHCTFATMSNNLILHKDPMVDLSNSARVNGQSVQAPLSLRFRNSIIWGDAGPVENEVIAHREGNLPYSVIFESGIWKMSQPYQNLEAIEMLTNENPLFELFEPGIGRYNFRLKAESPALNRGLNLALSVDLDGLPRANGLPDFGAYEKQ